MTEVDLVAGGPLERSHVEHICLGPQLEMTGHVLVWDRVDDDGTRLSDHPTIAVDVVPHAPRTVRRSPAPVSRYPAGGLCAADRDGFAKHDTVAGRATMDG